MFARVAVNVSAISGLYDYAIPNELAPHLQAGCLVIVPFGKQTVQGVVLELLESPAVENTKAIIDMLDPAPVLTPPQLALATQLAESTLNPLAAIVGLMLPVGISQQADISYELRIRDYKDGTSTVANRIVNLLRERGSLRGRQIDTHFSRIDWRKTAQLLVKKGVLSARHVLPAPRVRVKHIRVAQLAVTPEEAQAAMDSLGTKQTLARRQAALKFLIQQPEAVNLSWIYAETGCKLADLQELEERDLIRLFESEIFRDPLEKTSQQVGRQAFRILELTVEQSAALEKIRNAISKNDSQRPFLLQGVTGSGKTEIYLRAAEDVIKRGKQAIILVPEIALTPQTVRRFLARFPGQVGLVHSKLSEGERYDTWRRARAGKLKVIIGARSALFAPLPNIGLIVVDECHDSSYYQAEPPYYHAVAAAQEYARLCGAVCVLGSATPTMEQRFAANQGGLQKLDLSRRIVEAGLPPVHIVDMRDELKTGNRGIFSRALADSLAETLSRGEQAILFLNRRGTATYVFCRDCGTGVKCPNCDTPLTFHIEGLKRPNGLLCHRCGYERQMPKKCDVCGSTQIRAYGLGSEKVETEVKAMLPKARTLRWDWETTRKKDSHEMILTHFANHQADVLVGTQMLAKGLDLPRVTLVGIVLADVGLNLPDPFMGERVFQTLTQVAGRAGRSERGGKVILQTFMPGHYAIQSAAKHDVNGFYEQELNYRKALGYPPFARLVRLEYRHTDAARAEAEAQKVAEKLKAKMETEDRRQTELIGPVPCFFAKENGEYRWQVVLRGPNPASLLQDMKFAGWRVEIDPISLL
jgi:primosomal protein N' (replication factor Y) (superfamily II helicase)